MIQRKEASLVPRQYPFLTIKYNWVDQRQPPARNLIRHYLGTAKSQPIHCYLGIFRSYIYGV